MLANKTFCLWTKVHRIFFHGTWEESLAITFLSDFGYLESFRRYLWSKSKVAKNRAEFWTLFSSSQILGNYPSKSYTHVMIPVTWHVVWKMFCGDTPTCPEVTVASTLNFKPNFKFWRLKFFGGTPVPLRVCAIKAWSMSSACKIFAAQHPLWAEI